MLEISDEESNLDDADFPKKPPPPKNLLHPLTISRNHRRTLIAPKVIQNPQPAQPTIALDTKTNECLD